MPKTDPHVEAEKLFPGDRKRQDAYLMALGGKAAASTSRKRASTVKKKTPAKKSARRRLL